PPHAGHRLAIKAKNDVVFLQTGLFRGAVFDHSSYAGATHFAHAVAGHVFLADVFGIDAEEGAAVNQERKRSLGGLSRSRLLGRGNRLGIRGLLRAGNSAGDHTEAQNQSKQGYFLTSHYRSPPEEILDFPRG